MSDTVKSLTKIHRKQSYYFIQVVVQCFQIKILYFEQCINAAASFLISELVVIKSILKCFFGEVFVNYPLKISGYYSVIFIPLKSFFILGISTFGIGFILTVFHRLGHMDVANDIFQTFITTGERMLAKSFHIQ